MQQLLNGIWYSFPVQLVVLHVKKNLLLLFFWVLLFGFVTNLLLSKMGAAYLFLDPEYLGRVNFWGFFWVGLAFGFFFITWNIASYMMHSYRFPFLGTLHSPFFHFCINNSLIPLAFIVTYLLSLTRFQESFEFTPLLSVVAYHGAFLFGGALMVLFFALYFRLTNANLNTLLETLKRLEKVNLPVAITRRRRRLRRQGTGTSGTSEFSDKEWQVTYFLNHRLNIRRVRSTKHYARQTLEAVFQQNHANALIILGVALGILVLLGFLMDKPAFQLPAAASVLLILSVLMGLTGAFNFWLRGWRAFGLVIFFIIINFFTRYDWLNYDTKVYGLNYQPTPAPYNPAAINARADTGLISCDMEHALFTLHKWKTKNVPLAQPGAKPDMIILNYSGGGARAALWGMTVTQTLDSLLNNTLFDRTMLMCGSSGGMMAAAFLHELYYQQQSGNTGIVMHNPYYANELTRDYLNAVIFSIAVNDLFYPFQTFKTAGYTYRKNRAYAFEKQLSRNTGGAIALDGRRISDYYQAESNADIPMLLITPTIVTDHRKLYISSQPVSYLTRPYNQYNFTHSSFETDGVELMRFFEPYHAQNVLLSSAVRMSATFPYILPSTYLPTSPPAEVMDAGFRDNTGFETTYRFLHIFKDWINQNTGKVIVVFIRSDEKDRDVKRVTESLIEKVVKPITVFITFEMQDCYADYMATIADDELQGKLEVINFEYVPAVKNVKASMSLHLTTKEKQDIRAALLNEVNQKNLHNLLQILGR
ncbi:hypothetical protein C7N43_06115 [Sphingobacteriales bacterium UPWRP_1]|nr:hypothetical protein BVG80_11795 [Sphingobacteriales bacterium TSM_CSM]PSJ77908.1 hypothetical protein C7N43_06115 [Sphingobacteriales bacterium UPWRP_1]